MKKINSNSINYTDNIYYICRTILIIGLPLTIISGLVLSLSNISAITSGTDNLAITISSSCTLGSVVNTPHSKEVYNGNYETNIGKTTITTLCNDGNGYSIYANGFSDNEEGNNKLINSAYPQYSIDTGLATSGLISTWAMKLNNIENDPSPTPPTIDSSYNDTYGLVPNTWTKVAYRQSGTTDMSQGSSFTTTYSVYASSSQYNGTYNGQVKYLLTHPYSNSQYLGFNEAFALDNKNTIIINGNNYYTMQDMNSAICDAVKLVDEASATQLVDIRDNKLYWVAKLADGHCWMTQNLDFDINSKATLNSNTTDLNEYNINPMEGPYYYGYSSSNNTIYWEPTSTATTIDFAGTTIIDWQNSNTEPYSANKTDDMNTEHASLGNYYNWTTAIASNNSSTFTTDTNTNITNNPKNSICPKGWRLPTISNQPGTVVGSTNEFTRLNYLYNNNSTSNDQGLISEPLYFMYSGIIDAKSSNTLISLGSLGLYMSSTNFGAQGFYGIRFQANKVSIEQFNQDYNGKQSGFSVRCVAR